MMDLTESIIRACAEAVCGTTQVGVIQGRIHWAHGPARPLPRRS
jgi:hypothetical protein